MNIFKKLWIIYRDFKKLQSIIIKLESMELSVDNLVYCIEGDIEDCIGDIIEDACVKNVVLKGEEYKGSQQELLNTINLQSGEIEKLRGNIKDLKSKLFKKDFIKIDKDKNTSKKE